MIHVVYSFSSGQKKIISMYCHFLHTGENRWIVSCSKIAAVGFDNTDENWWIYRVSIIPIQKYVRTYPSFENPPFLLAVVMSCQLNFFDFPAIFDIWKENNPLARCVFFTFLCQLHACTRFWMILNLERPNYSKSAIQEHWNNEFLKYEWKYGFSVFIFENVL